MNITKALGIVIVALEDELEAEDERAVSLLWSGTGTRDACCSASLWREDAMNWKAMADTAEQAFQQRGGSKAATEDAEELHRPRARLYH